MVFSKCVPTFPVLMSCSIIYFRDAFFYKNVVLCERALRVPWSVPCVVSFVVSGDPCRRFVSCERQTRPSRPRLTPAALRFYYYRYRNCASVRWPQLFGYYVYLFPSRTRPESADVGGAARGDDAALVVQSSAMGCRFVFCKLFMKILGSLEDRD